MNDETPSATLTETPNATPSEPNLQPIDASAHNAAAAGETAEERLDWMTNEALLLRTAVCSIIRNAREETNRVHTWLTHLTQAEQKRHRQAFITSLEQRSRELLTLLGQQEELLAAAERVVGRSARIREEPDAPPDGDQP